MANRTLHKTPPNTRMAQLVYRAKNFIRSTATGVSGNKSLVNIYNLVMTKDDVDKIQSLNRDMFKATKELKIFHSAFNNKREVELVQQLQNQMHEIDKRCSCALEHLDNKDADSN